MPQHLGRRVLAVLLLVGAAVAVVVTRPPRLGLDLPGGTQIVLEARDTSQRQVDAGAVGCTLEVLQRLVDQLGVAEPALQRAGDRRIIVELPEVQDPVYQGDLPLTALGRPHAGALREPIRPGSERLVGAVPEEVDQRLRNLGRPSSTKVIDG